MNGMINFAKRQTLRSTIKPVSGSFYKSIFRRIEMKDEISKPKKTTPPWLLGIIVVISFTLLVLLQSSNVWRNLSVETANDTVLLYALSSLNFFALVIFGFIFTRSILKLARERRALQLGSKLKTRLLLYFIAISILPIIAMAVFSYLFMNRALERWFTQIPEDVVRKAGEMQNQAIKDQNLKLIETAAMLANVLNSREIGQEELKSISSAGNLTRIEILSETGALIAESEKQLDSGQKTELDKTVQYIRENKFFDPALSDGRGFDAAVAKFSDGRILVVVPDLRPNENLTQLVDSSLAQFDSLKEKNITIRQIGLLTLGVLTFLLIFASSWAAFYVAKGLTRPIRALAEGADELARGNLTHRVEVLAEDELELLVAAFNQMSETLVRNSDELGERRKYIETVLQSLSTGVISFDADDRITTINVAAIKMFDLEDENFENLQLASIVSAENFNVLEKLIHRAKRIGRANEQTVLQRERTDGNGGPNENLPVALSAAALSLSSGDEKGVVLVIEDLSELIAAQRAFAWQEVARRMAHEIKNPLTPIQLAAERIAKNFHRYAGNVREDDLIGNSPNRSVQMEKVVDESTETILREVSSLKAMVDEFSRYARLPDTLLEDGDLNEILRQSVALYQDREVNFELDLDDSLPTASIDQEQIKRVFINLMENSFEAFEKTQKDKTMTLKTHFDGARGLIVVQIADNGNGIRPQDLQRVFQPYFSTKGRGTGLGLAIVQRIILEHGGKIHVAANSPKGTKFVVELPISS